MEDSRSTRRHRRFGVGLFACAFTALTLVSTGCGAEVTVADLNELLEQQPTAAGEVDRPLIDPYSLPVIAVQPGDIAPWKNTYYANALAAGEWLEFGGKKWGSPVQLWNNKLFYTQGYPRWLNWGKKLRALLTGFDAQHPDLAQGHVVLTWKGWGDIRLSGATAYLADQSSGPATGGLSNGQRVYRFSGDDVLSDLVIHQIAGPSDPITDIKVWLPDPADPDNASLEGKLWHPTFVQRLKDEDWGLLRTTALTRTRGNPQRDWADRRRPDHVFADGILNPREPADGATDSTGRGFAGNRLTGVPYEHLVALANTADLDLWISVPHLASDDYVTRLAQLLRFGSDGNNPYTSPVANPTWAPLEPGRRLFVEYADALWVDGEPQAAWAEAQANQNGLTKPVFLAQHTARVWSLFAPYFSDDAASDNQLVRVGSASTIDEWATHDYLTELGKTSHGHPDVIALNTDFGVGLADWVNTTARQRANTSDPWFYTATTGSSRSADDAYWTSPAFEHHLEEAFNEWQRRLDAALADETQAAPGYLTSTVIQSIEAVVGQVPIVATGGTALQTHHLDTAQAGDEGITHFMTAMSRHPRIADVYRNYLDAAFAIGLVSYIPHALTDNYSARSQWGHLEHVGQASNTAPKYQFLRDYLAGDTAGLDTAGAGRTARAAAEPVPLAAASIPTAFAVQTRAAPAGTNLIRNGSFENPVVTGNKGRYQRYTGSQMPGWQITGNIDLITKSVWQPAAGAQLLDLNGTNVGAIQQRVTGLKANGLYQLRFAYARHRSGNGDDPRSADVLVNGKRIASLSTAVAAPNYLTATYKVNANSAGELLLKFASTSLNTGTGIVFDDIQLSALYVEDTSTPEPEPKPKPTPEPAPIEDNTGSTAAPVPTGTNLIRNGSFENPVVTGNKGRYQRYTGSQMPGWQITGNIDLITKSVWQPAAGAQLLDLNGTNVGAIQQRVTGLKANGLYQLRFAYARHRSGNGDDPRSADVLVNGKRIASLSTAVAAPNYLTATYKVNANSAGELLLKFASTSLNTGTGIVFDDVQLSALYVEDTSTPEPEPEPEPEPKPTPEPAPIEDNTGSTAAPVPTGTNLIQNGSFENPVVTGNKGRYQRYTGSQMPGWQITGNIDLITKSVWQPAAGAQLLDLNGTNVGAIQQRVTGLKANGLYQLRFAYARHRSGNGDDPRSADVLVNGKRIASLSTAVAAPNYLTATYKVNANSAGELLLKFASTSLNTGTGIVFDDVQLSALYVEDTSTPEPEPEPEPKPTPEPAPIEDNTGSTAAPVPTGTNLIQNGSFENPVVTGNKGRYQYYAGSQMPGWQITGNIDLITKSVWQPAAGAQLLDLNGTKVGAIQQRVTGLKANGLYQLRFAYARHRSGNEPRSADVLVNSKRIASLSTAVAAPNYLTATYRVNANSAGELLLKFASTSLNTGTGMVFDDVQLSALYVEDTSTPEPEPKPDPTPVDRTSSTTTSDEVVSVPTGAKFLYLNWRNTTNTLFDPSVSNFNTAKWLPGITSGALAGWGITDRTDEGVKLYSKTDPGFTPPNGEKYGIETEFGDTSITPRSENTGTVRHYVDCGQTGFQNAGLDRSEFHARTTLQDLEIEEGAEVWLGWSEYYTSLDKDRLTTILQFRNQPGPNQLLEQGVITQAQYNNAIHLSPEGREVTQGGPAIAVELKASNGVAKYHFAIREGAPLSWARPDENVHTLDWNVQTGQWYDFIVHMKYSQADDGFFRVWVAPSGTSDTPLEEAAPSWEHTGSNMYQYPTLNGNQVTPVPEIRWGIYRFNCKTKNLKVPLSKDNRYMNKHLGPVRILQGHYRETGFDLVKPRGEG